MQFQKQFLSINTDTVMILMFSEEQLMNAKSSDKMPFTCEMCSQTFYALKKHVLRARKAVPKKKLSFCSQQCAGLSKRRELEFECGQCKKHVITTVRSRPNSKSGANFCSMSCAGRYNQTHKTTGTRRSKLETWLESKLLTHYPNLRFVFNGKETINSELDIYIPELKLAFELNGIFHYEPIYGSEKLALIQNNDGRKFQACYEAGISLAIIDVSSMKNFKEKRAQQYLDIIIGLISKRSGGESNSTQ